MAYRRTAGVQARLDQQRTDIVVAAAEVLAEGGYAACSVAAVAERAGVAAGTVYNRMRSKSELFAEVFGRVVDHELAVVAAAVDAAPDTAARLTAVVTTFADRALQAPVLARALLVEPVAPELAGLRLRSRAAFRDVVAAVIDTGVRHGEIPAQSADVVAAAVVGAVAEALVGPLGGVADPSAVPTLVAFVLRSTGVLVDACHA